MDAYVLSSAAVPSGSDGDRRPLKGETMKRVLCLVVLASFVLLPEPVQARSKDLAKGNGTAGGVNDFHFIATSEFDGSDAKGHVRFQVGQTNPLTVLGKVTCLSVVGNVARIEGTVEDIRPTPTGHESFILVVVDNGSTGTPPDTFSAGLHPFPPSTLCPPFAPSALPVTEGDIVVEDATTP
jgi:hypothetical protein